VPSRKAASGRRTSAIKAGGTPDATAQLAGFIAKFSPGIATLATALLQKMRELLPGAVELVYDNYNALAIGFSPSEKASEGIFSIALYPRWVSLFFLQGARLRDPEKLLRGGGKQVRYIVLPDVNTLADPRIQALMKQAMNAAAVPIDANGKGRLVIKSVSAKQRARLPSK
jgi:hypothetical protein